MFVTEAKFAIFFHVFIALTPHALATSESDGYTPFNTNIRPILREHCGYCHGYHPDGGAPQSFTTEDMDDSDQKAGIRTMAKSMRGRIESGTMPPAGAPALTESNRKVLLAWLDGIAAEKSFAFPRPNWGDEIDPPEDDPPENESGTGATQIVTLSALSPSSKQTAPSSNLRVPVSFETDISPVGYVWDMFKTSTEGTTTGGDAVVQNLSLATKTTQWNLESVPNGEYFYYVVIRRGSTIVSKAASVGSVLVARNAPPSLEWKGLWLPETIVLVRNADNSTFPVTWLAADPENETLSFNVKISKDDGKTFAAVDGVSNSSGTSFSSISEFLPENRDYVLRVVVSDSAANSSTFEKKFSVANKLYSYADDMRPIFSVSTYGCDNCHTSTTGFRSTTYSSALSNAALIRSQIKNKIMPKPDPAALPGTDATKIILWIDQGAKP